MTFNPNKDRLFEGSFFLEVSVWSPLIFQEELIEYQYNFV